MIDPAPPRFSTTIDWPRMSPTWRATSRPTASAQLSITTNRCEGWREDMKRSTARYAGRGAMGDSEFVDHDPSVAVKRRHLPFAESAKGREIDPPGWITPGSVPARTGFRAV